MKIAWITDPHFNFINDQQIHKFARSIGGHNPDAVIITGDIAEALSVKEKLNTFADSLKTEMIYFVLGNHDFYRGSFASVKKDLAEGLSQNLIQLDELPPITLAPDIALVGNQGWFDGREGDAIHSNVVMNDFESIADLRAVYNRHTWLEGARDAMLLKLGDLAYEHACASIQGLTKACATHRKVIFATHFPPFKGSNWHQGGISDNNWLPWFTNKTMGDALEVVAKGFPQTQILVLCGHTHSPGKYRHLPNLVVVTGEAEYGAPSLSGLIDDKSFEGWV